ncbi:hypothetical protein ACP4J4_06520 [Aureimonas ureilytica]|uniref:hypothetical protein n=1 Tax=Aureimonas ureilytica TaxID=401562 RepID=UPI003CEF88BA
MTFEWKTFVSRVETGKRRIPRAHDDDRARAQRMETREFVATLLFHDEPGASTIILGDRRAHGTIGG